MLTTDKTITTAEYWDGVYTGKRDNAKQDSSNGVRPKNAFDRFGWVVDQVDEGSVIEIGAGHARICERLRAKGFKTVLAVDQSEEARNASKFRPYLVNSAYALPAANGSYETMIACQCLEYMDDLPRFFKEAQRVAYHLICTIPIGQMDKWSQLYVWTPESFLELVSQYGQVLHTDVKEGLMLVKMTLR